MSADSKRANWAIVGAAVIAGAGIIYYFWPTSPAIDGDSAQSDGDDTKADGDGHQGAASGRPPLPDLPPVGQRSARPAGPKLPERKGKAAAKPSTTSGQSSTSSAEEQARIFAETKDKPEIHSFADAVKVDAPQDKSEDKASASQDSSTAQNKDGQNEDAPHIAWSQTQDEVSIWIGISDAVKKHQVGFKLLTAHIEVEVQGTSLLAGHLPHPVQPDDSNWQFDTRQGQRVLAITLQKASDGVGCALWHELIRDAPGTSVHNR